MGYSPLACSKAVPPAGVVPGSVTPCKVDAATGGLSLNGETVTALPPDCPSAPGGGGGGLIKPPGGAPGWGGVEVGWSMAGPPP
jgi:hypothetical protein